MAQTNSKRMVNASLWTTLSFALGKIAQFIAQFIVARLLSPEDFGIWAMVLVLSNFSLIFRDTAIAQVLVQKGLDDDRLVNTVYSIGINVSILLFILQSLAGFPLSCFFNKPILFPLAALSGIVFLIGAGAGSHSAVLQRKMRFKELAICDFYANFARVFALILSSFYGFGFWAFAIGEISMALVDSLAKRFLSKYKFKYYLKLDKDKVNEVKTFIVGVLASKIAHQINITADNIIIGKLLGAKALGHYNVAYQLAATPAFAFSQINNRVIFSTLSLVSNESKFAMLQRLFEYYATAAGFVYGLAFTLIPSLITLVYGESWKESIRVCQIILIFCYTSGFMSILGAYLLSINKSLQIARIDWFIVPVSLTAYYIGAQIGGIQGVAIAATCVMGFFASTWYLTSACRIAKLSMKDLLQSVGLPMLSALIAVVAVHIIPYADSAVIFLKTFTFIGLYVTIMALLSKGRLPFSIIKLILQKKINVNS